jgi:glycosyltransferase involved in cell wall biosynthesis
VIAQDGETEGVPNSVLEAMSAGLPIISTMHPGIMDIVENGKNGLLSAEHDVDAMARNILAMTADPDRAFIMGQAGRGMIHQHYSLAAQMCGLRTIMNKSSFWPNPTSPSGCATGHGPISDGP